MRVRQFWQLKFLAMLLLLSAGQFASTRKLHSEKMSLSAADELARSLVGEAAVKRAHADELARSLVDETEEAGAYKVTNGAELDDPPIRYKAVASNDPTWNRRALQAKGIPLRAGHEHTGPSTGLRVKEPNAGKDTNERITSYIASGIALAQVPACKAALERAHLNATCKPPKPGHAGGSPERLHAVYSKAAGLAYFKTAKAGSVSFQNYLSGRYNDSSCTIVKHCSGSDLPLGQLPDLSHIFGFTFVRDPLERALAGYAEVDAVHSRARSPKQRDAEIKAAGTTYTGVPRKHGTHGTDRFLAYLDDLANNRLPQWKTGHSCRRLVLSAGSSGRQ